MHLQFNQLPESLWEGFKGGEGTVHARLATPEGHKLMRLTLPVGASIGMHRHETSSETLYVLSGTARFVTPEGTEIVRPGEAHHCPCGGAHALHNDGSETLELFAVVAEK